jgi:hypothetical protein
MTPVMGADDAGQRWVSREEAGWYKAYTHKSEKHVERERRILL